MIFVVDGDTVAGRSKGGGDISENCGEVRILRGGGVNIGKVRKNKKLTNNLF